ncbi:elongator complex protein 6-like [Pyrus ussuriensis x Pyrus communis]|uniref:Elongator complex protein 6-like n=1 Tax=Pyrus ussuriensis x Pyrus communis TaxID=2448454 RepID=A0A5N5F576_9ROSA|nr:elongator complex protein 6-like [Pyrus ussuriensis x Pyrus communis]
MSSLPAFLVTSIMVRNAVQSNVLVKADEWVEVQRSHICFLSGSPTRGVVIGVVGTVVIVSVFVHGGRFGKGRRLREWSGVAEELEGKTTTSVLE